MTIEELKVVLDAIEDDTLKVLVSEGNSVFSIESATLTIGKDGTTIAVRLDIA